MGRSQTIVAVYLSQQAFDARAKYTTWTETIDEAIAAIGTTPYPPGWETRPHTTLRPEKYDGCMLVDYPPFQYAYRFSAPDEIEIVVITLCFPHNVMM